MAASSEAIARAGLIDPKKPATYPVVLGEDITGRPGDPSSKQTFVGIRFNFKSRQLADKSTPRTATLTAKDPDHQNREDSEFDVTFRDNSGGRYVYAGTRTAKGSKYVLVLDSKLRRFILHRLDSLYALNMTDSPTNHDPAALKKKYPHIDHATKRIRPPRGTVATRRPVIVKKSSSSTAPLRPRPKPLVRPSPRPPPSVLRSSQDIKRMSEKRAFLSAPVASSHGAEAADRAAKAAAAANQERETTVVSPTKTTAAGRPMATSPTAIKTKKLGSGSPYVSPVTPMRGKLGAGFSSKPREGSKLYKETRPSPDSTPGDRDDAEDLPRSGDRASKSVAKSADRSMDKAKANKANPKPFPERKDRDATSSPLLSKGSSSSNSSSSSSKTSRDKWRGEVRGDSIEVKVGQPERSRDGRGSERDTITVLPVSRSGKGKDNDGSRGKDPSKGKDAGKDGGRSKDGSKARDRASSSSSNNGGSGSGSGSSTSSSKSKEAGRSKDLGGKAAATSAAAAPKAKTKSKASSGKEKAAAAAPFDLPMPKPLAKPAVPPPEPKKKKARDWEEEDDDDDDGNYEDIGLVIEFPGGPSSASAGRDHNGHGGGGGGGGGKGAPPVPKVHMRTFDDFQRANALGLDEVEEVGSDEDMEGDWDPRQEAAAAGSSSSSTAAPAPAPAPAANNDGDEDMDDLVDELEEELLKELQEEEARKKLEAELEAEMEAQLEAAAAESEVSEEE